MIQLYGHFGGCTFSCCSIVVCGKDRCFYYVVHPIYINEGRIRGRNTSLFIAMYFNSVMKVRFISGLLY